MEWTCIQTSIALWRFLSQASANWDVKALKCSPQALLILECMRLHTVSHHPRMQCLHKFLGQHDPQTQFKPFKPVHGYYYIHTYSMQRSYNYVKMITTKSLFRVNYNI